MAYHVVDLNPVTHITVGTVGPPGKRVFFLQGSQGTRLVSLVIEKEHAFALAVGIQELLEQLAKEREPEEWAEEPVDLELKEPLDTAYRVSQLGLGYDERSDRVVIVAEAWRQGEEEGEADVLVVRFWATRHQMAALSDHALKVVAAGRPTCPLCGNPIDPEGHFCPRRNGHQHREGTS